MRRQWVSGNRCTLLENGEDFFPRVLDCVREARTEILIETFILYADKVGNPLQEALLQAARRGVAIDISVDDFGACTLPEAYIAALAAEGVRFHIFDPLPKPFRRINYFRRLHRKLTVIDGRIAFVGGINYSADHLGDFGPEAKQDYSVEIQGPIAASIRRFMLAEIAQGTGTRRKPVPSAQPEISAPQPEGDAEVMFVWRDNRRHKNDIERQYRLAFRLARHRIVIANAYFFPGYRFLRDMRRAARRGVEISLILQGKPDMRIVKIAATMLYAHLLRAKVRIYEYCARPLHAKVAIVDDEWATVGSSNLDPISLSLNLEANVVIRDPDFNRQLAQSLERLMQHSCREIALHEIRHSGIWPQLRSAVVFHFLRHFPSWIDWFPSHNPTLKPVLPSSSLPEGADRMHEPKGAQ